MLDEGSAAPDVERLDAEADGEQGFMQIVGVLEEELVDGLAAGVGGGGFGFEVLAVLLRVDVGSAAGEQDALAAIDEVGDSRLREIQRDFDGLAAGALDRVGVLGPGALAVGEVSAVGDGDGDAAGLHLRILDYTMIGP